MATPIRRALLSVSDKTGLVEFAQALADKGVELLSTGGTFKTLKDAGIPVIEVSSHTGFPEIMDGRVKTLHPKIHGGLLALRDNDEHVAAMAEHDIAPIDLLAVNLYPFESTVAAGADFDTCIENIDIGGPAMIRAAAKNWQGVCTVVDVEDYALVLEELNANNGTTEAFRKKMSATAYARTGAYDAAISNWYAKQLEIDYPKRKVFAGELKQTMRYGENSHQSAAFYVTGENRPGVATAEQLNGKELSYNNVNDTDAAFELVSEFKDDTACVIVKHANPCGVAVGDNLKDAYLRAYSCDTESAFGGIVAFNKTLDGATAEELSKIFLEVVIAPQIDEDALAILSGKKNVRVLQTGGMPNAGDTADMVKTMSGGLLVQSKDNQIFSDDFKVVTERQPTEAEMKDLRFAFTVCKHVKSNAIIYCKNNMTVGVGAGQMSRVNSCRIAAFRAEQAAKTAGDSESWAKGSVVASDAFFPFADGLIEAAEAGATAVIQPGGSIRDEEVIAAANERGLAMVFTGMRHFRH
ncbi:MULTISPECIES: bifunctional phosphoribosylaminoimidazolecarboxamide formyltransferase/IMP cyclohydrolase [Terasakiella]|uniref:Bifunctional purine biosynthesis protein PurH n=1 Tax=Terasakiella brassicae TaxID=1634917 RepID=A0A917F9D5_9PROT|nr:bifunctional phosphoribosylaminoimidazolecarboxamide formyltransferase/IMP cyclohydrolase [Terasakiella brassicae]GGF59459.1 bifunctional purine biosynthesis protein PurH [Terasakiella brassicae]